MVVVHAHVTEKKKTPSASHKSWPNLHGIKEKKALIIFIILILFVITVIVINPIRHSII